MISLFRLVNGIVTCGPCPDDNPYGNGKVCYGRKHLRKQEKIHHTFQYQPHNPR